MIKIILLALVVFLAWPSMELRSSAAMFLRTVADYIEPGKRL